MRTLLLTGLIGGTLAAAVALALHGNAGSPDSHNANANALATGSATAPHASLAPGATARRIGNLPDRGALAAYRAEAPMRRGAATLYPVQLSEAHARASIGSGRMTLRTPQGAQVEMTFEQKLDHGDGNWTWVGHPAGTPEGAQAMITFGPKAVFGSIPQRDGEPLEIASVRGRAFIVETNPRLLPKQGPERDVDALVPTNVAGAAMASMAAMPVSASASVESMTRAATTPRTAAAGAMRSAAAPQSASLTASAAPLTSSNMSVSPLHTIDLVVGYTTHFADRLGGASEAMTRITFLVDLANQTLANSQVPGHVRLVNATQVSYADATVNRTALMELTGVTCVNATGPTRTEFPDNSVTCTRTSAPAALQPLVNAREQFGGDVVVLLRTFEDPEQQTCGVGWMLGGGQQPLDATNAPYAYSVVSDSSAAMFPDPDTNNTCRSEQLAHEIGHTLGLQHEAEIAQGANGVLDPEDYGRYAYSFGYRELATAGNFYTVMAQRFTGGTSYLVFSNPRITFCGGLPCGTATADNARTVTQTLPMVAAFRQPIAATAGAWPRGDFDGDGSVDIFWRNPATGQDALWRSGDSATQITVNNVWDLNWVAVGAADFTGDGKSDVLWRNNLTGQNLLWKSALNTTPQTVASVANQNWYVAGAGDFDGDGKADILWRNSLTGGNVAWRSANSATVIAMGSVRDSAWNIVGVGDFDGDHKDDILWRNTSTGANLVWRSGNNATMTTLTVAPTVWFVAGVADFDGDGRDDILWRNSSTGQNTIWKSGVSTTGQAVASVPDKAWMVVGVGDFNHDGKADILWRHGTSGKMVIWRSALSTTPQAVTTVSNFSWQVAG